MKKIFIFLKSLSHMGAAAQEIAKEFKTTTYNSCEVIAADNQYIYLGYGITELFNILPKAQYLYRLDFNLQMVDSVNLTKGLSLDTNERLHLKDIEVDTNGNIYALCFIHEQNAPTQCNGRKSLLLKLGPSFQPLDTIYFESDSLDITLVDMAIKKNTAVLTGSAFICNQILRPYVAKINLNTSSVWSKFYDSLTYNTTLQFIDPAFFADKIILHAVRGIGPPKVDYLRWF
ncbi:MAG: hypothetical protein U5L96_20545 [Owenweeksia sp.]|nr:hypothetical protein [Owenweeksia sp.]